MWGVLAAYPTAFTRDTIALELRHTLLEAWREVQRRQRTAAAMHEAPIAQLTALYANAHRDPSKGKPFTAADFTLYRDRDDTQPRLPREAVAALLSLHNDALTTPLLLAAWPDVLAGAAEAGATPECRAYANTERTLWLVAPTVERGGVRSALVACAGVSGTVLVQDVDRPLVTHRVVVPPRPQAAWLEARLLLATAAPET